jgi:hypothetical protein
MTDAAEISDNERFYDEVVAPELAKLNALMQDRGMGFVATVEYNPGDFGTTANPAVMKSDGCLLTYSAARSMGNIDSMAIAWAKHVRESGRPHGSMVLNQMGVNPDPDKRT